MAAPFQQINPLVVAAASQYLNRNGNQYRHAGVCLPLDMEVLTVAIEAQIVGSLMIQYGGEVGQSRALIFLAAMFTYGELNDRGADMLDYMLRCFCDDVREMLDTGLDPAEVLSHCVGGVQ